MKKEIKELEIKITNLKQMLEQETLRADKAESYMLENYPAITDMVITKGWYGSGVSTFRVKLECLSDDLHKLVKLLTHNTLSRKKYSRMREVIKKDLEREKLTNQGKNE